MFLECGIPEDMMLLKWATRIELGLWSNLLYWAIHNNSPSHKSVLCTVSVIQLDCFAKHLRMVLAADGISVKLDYHYYYYYYCY